MRSIGSKRTLFLQVLLHDSIAVSGGHMCFEIPPLALATTSTRVEGRSWKTKSRTVVAWASQDSSFPGSSFSSPAVTSAARSRAVATSQRVFDKLKDHIFCAKFKILMHYTSHQKDRHLSELYPFPLFFIFNRNLIAQFLVISHLRALLLARLTCWQIN